MSFLGIVICVGIVKYSEKNKSINLLSLGLGGLEAATYRSRINEDSSPKAYVDS